jgi:hypothetical protein
MVNQIGEYLKETESIAKVSLPAAVVEIFKCAPEQERAPRELVEWIKQVKIEERHSKYDYNTWLSVSNLMRTIAIDNHYSPLQYERAEERAGLELQNRTHGKRIDSQFQKLTN